MDDCRSVINQQLLSLLLNRPSSLQSTALVPASSYIYHQPLPYNLISHESQPTTGRRSAHPSRSDSGLRATTQKGPAELCFGSPEDRLWQGHRRRLRWDDAGEPSCICILHSASATSRCVTLSLYCLDWYNVQQVHAL